MAALKRVIRYFRKNENESYLRYTVVFVSFLSLYPELSICLASVETNPDPLWLTLKTFDVSQTISAPYSQGRTCVANIVYQHPILISSAADIA